MQRRKSQRKGIADYFNPTVPVNRISGGGNGAFGGDSVFTEHTLAHNGTGASQANPMERNKAAGQQGADTAAAAAEAAKLAEIERKLTANSGESMASDRALRHIVTRVTDEGLIVELFDLPDDPLFDAQNRPLPILDELTRVLARVFGLVTNRVAVNGHVRSAPVVLRNDPVWPSSSVRAATVRDRLVADGLQPQRVERVSAFADRKPAARNPTAVRNNRIELILLRTPPPPPSALDGRQLPVSPGPQKGTGAGTG